MTAPGYPFSARDIFGDLRSRLAAEHRRPKSSERLAKMLGRSKSTTYNWFDIFHHPQVLGFLCHNPSESFRFAKIFTTDGTDGTDDGYPESRVRSFYP